MEATIQIRKGGALTLPSTLRTKYAIQEGDTFRLVDVDGLFVLIPTTPGVSELAREIERMRQEAGLSLEEMIQSLRQERERYSQEKYSTD